MLVYRRKPKKRILTNSRDFSRAIREQPSIVQRTAAAAGLRDCRLGILCCTLNMLPLFVFTSSCCHCYSSSCIQFSPLLLLLAEIARQKHAVPPARFLAAFGFHGHSTSTLVFHHASRCAARTTNFTLHHHARPPGHKACCRHCQWDTAPGKPEIPQEMHRESGPTCSSPVFLVAAAYQPA